jgi:predicted lipoprotein with Yx(FWY)xxD motif
MTMLKRLALAGACIAAITLAACGSSNGTSSTNGGNGGYGYSYSTPATNTPTTAPASGALVQTGSAMVKGAQTAILTDGSGMTLYYLTQDTATTPACTGGCLNVWPPLLGTAGQTPNANGVTGTFSLLSDASRPQVEYNGHLLYHYGGDSKPGDANGEGISGVWFVAVPGLAAGSSSGGNGYGH